MKQMRKEKKQSTKVIRSAVYVLLLQGEVVYVGESINPYSRLGAHVKDSNKRFDSIRILPCAKHRRHYWEAVLIYKYQPLFNKKGKKKETAIRHIHALSKIKEGQEKSPVYCKNCDPRNSIYNHTGLSTANFHALERHRGVVTKACTTVGTITIETMPASDEEYIEILEDDKRRKKEKAWDNSVGYTEKIYNSLDIGFKTSNPYRSTSVTDPQSLKKLFDTV
tara:strand:- start:280 stop:945 length:666 start_codon:yes stop_codon:yes gene_type:complete